MVNERNNPQNPPDLQTIMLQKDIEFIKEMLRELKDFFVRTKEEHDDKFATKEQLKAFEEKSKEQLKALEDRFKPTKMIAYGIAYGTMGMVLVAILSTIITKK